MPLLQLTKHPALYEASQRGCQTPQSRLGRPGDVVIMTFCHPKWRFRKRKYIDAENFCAAPCGVCSHKDLRNAPNRGRRRNTSAWLRSPEGDEHKAFWSSPP